MKKLVLAMLALPVFILFFVIYAVWSLNIHKLIICSSDSDAFYLPSSVCEYYLYNSRGTKEDIDFLDKHIGISFLFDTRDTGKKYKLLKFFLERGADINRKNKIDGLTPLHISILNNDLMLLKFLLDHGANRNVKDVSNKMNAIEFANMLQTKTPSVNRQPIISVLNNT